MRLMIRRFQPDFFKAERVECEIELSIRRIRSRFVPVWSRVCAKVMAPHT